MDSLIYGTYETSPLYSLIIDYLDNSTTTYYCSSYSIENKDGIEKEVVQLDTCNLIIVSDDVVEKEYFSSLAQKYDKKLLVISTNDTDDDIKNMLHNMIRHNE